MFDLFMPAIGKKKEPAPLELNLPRGWNALTIEQLEEVSRILIDTAKKNTATGQWDRADMMTRCFFAVSGLEAVGLIHEPEEEFSVAPPALTGDDEADEELQAQYQEALRPRNRGLRTRCARSRESQRSSRRFPLVYLSHECP